MSATVYENFKWIFGYYSTSVVEDKKNKVDGVLTKLEKAMEGLSETTKQAQMSYHPGKAGNMDSYKSMRERFVSIPGQRLNETDAYNAYDAIEKQANTALGTVYALKEADRRIGDIRKMAPEEIDKMVDDIETDMLLGAPGALNGDEERGLLIAAIKVRYGIDEVVGDLPHDVLLRFYHLLSLVPENHTKANPKLNIIKRTSMTDTSLYSTDGGGTIAINGGEVGGGLFNSNREEYSNGAGVTMKLNRFDAHTLHEVGHAVDDACGFMALHGKKLAFGGWNPSGYEEAADAGVSRVKNKYDTIAPSVLKHLLLQSMANKTFDETIATWQRETRTTQQLDRVTLLGDPAVQEADRIVRVTLEANPLPWSREAKNQFDDALRMVNILPLTRLEGQQRQVINNFIRTMKDQIRRAAELADQIAAAADALRTPDALRAAWEELSAWGKTISKELWWAGSTKITDASYSGRVYQNDNGKWWSYDITTRGAKVQDYQFRSPGEWFAEVYAMEMLGRLADSHPCKKLIRTLDTSRKLTE